MDLTELGGEGVDMIHAS